MYNLEGGVIWTQELKNAFKTGTTYCSVIHNQQEYNESNFLKEAELKDVKYVPNAGFIGQAVSKMLTIKMVNNEESNLNFENANVQFKIGAKYNDIIYYINYGNFIVNEPPENDDTNGTVKFIAYDYMIKFNQDYTNRVSYPCTLKDLLLDICSQAGVELGSTTFQNEKFKVEDNQFEGKQLRDVLQHIAKCAFSWARIGQDNKLYLDFEVNNNIDEIITIDDYKMDAFKKANEYYGPINKVTYADSDIKGQEISVLDDASIATYGEKEIIIYDNYFAYNKKKRQKLIRAGTALFGLRYMPVQNLELIGLVYLDCTDIIGVQDGAGTTYLTRVFSHIIKYNGAVSDTIETTGESDNEKRYSNPNNSIAQNSRTEIIVDRAKKQIAAIAEEIGDRSQKTTTITADIDGLNSKVEDLEDLTNEVNGTKTITLENCIEGNLLELHIYGNNTVFKQLYPRNNLYPSNDLFPSRASRIIVTDENNNSVVYELGITEVLRQNGDIKDEYILQDGVAKIIRRINQDGTIKTNEVVEDLGEFYIYLLEGTNTITIQNYTAPIKAKFAIKSDYTEVFATKVEMNSSITQTAEEINLEVRKKVDENEVISKINQSAEAVGISANKIELSANDVLNLLAGNTINLSSENIEIKANDVLINNQGMTFTYNNSKVGGFQTEEIDGDASKRGISMIIDNNAYFLGLGKYDSNGVAQQILTFYNRATSSHDNAIQIGNPNWNTFVTIHEDAYVYGYLSAANLINRSLETLKKDIEKSNFNATKEVMNTDIYSYRLKEEKENQKKHFGVIIGDNYKCSDKILNEDKDGVELYSMTSILWKAFQEQQEEIEKLRKEINNGL